jgi:dihydrodipicolinate reductase
MELLAQSFPGAFSGYKLEVTESHQRQKADTSGTAKAIVASFAKLGAPIEEVGGNICLTHIVQSCNAHKVSGSRSGGTCRRHL